MFFDTHADIWTDILHSREKGITNRLRDFHHPRMTQYNMAGGIFVIWIDPPYDTAPQGRILQAVKAMFAEVNASRNIMTIVRTYGDFIKAREEGKLAVIAGLEGLSGIGEDTDWLYTLHALGFRHASLTWNEENPLATGARGPEKRGLTPAGIKAVRIMEELGMLVDISHANPKTFWDIYENTGKPIIASHSNCSALCNNRRNLNDDQLTAVAKRGGVVGAVAYSPFIHDDPLKRTLSGLADNIDHMVQVMGVDHVSLGFDFGDYLNQETIMHFQEGDTYSPKGIEDISGVPALLRELETRGYSQEDMEKIRMGNILRVCQEILPEE